MLNLGSKSQIGLTVVPELDDVYVDDYVAEEMLVQHEINISNDVSGYVATPDDPFAD